MLQQFTYTFPNNLVLNLTRVIRVTLSVYSCCVVYSLDVVQLFFQTEKVFRHLHQLDMDHIVSFFKEHATQSAYFKG